MTLYDLHVFRMVVNPGRFSRKAQHATATFHNQKFFFRQTTNSIRSVHVLYRVSKIQQLKCQSVPPLGFLGAPF